MTDRQDDPRYTRGAKVWARISGGATYTEPDDLVRLGDYESTRDERRDLAHFMSAHDARDAA